MIVISRNGSTTVYRGWRAWLIGAAAFLAVWLIIAIGAIAFVGVAITTGLLMLLALPALLVVTLLSAIVRRRGR